MKTPLTVVYTNANPLEIEVEAAFSIAGYLGKDIGVPEDSEKSLELYTQLDNVYQTLNLFSVSLEDKVLPFATITEESTGIIFPIIGAIDETGTLPAYNTTPLSLAAYAAQKGNTNQHARVGLTEFIVSQIDGRTPAYNRWLLDMFVLQKETTDAELVTLNEQLYAGREPLSHIIVYDKPPLFLKTIDELKQAYDVQAIDVLVK